MDIPMWVEIEVSDQFDLYYDGKGKSNRNWCAQVVRDLLAEGEYRDLTPEQVSAAIAYLDATYDGLRK